MPPSLVIGTTQRHGRLLLQPQGFRLGAIIYALDGTPFGRVWAEKAYRFDGSYVGALVKNMVVEKAAVSRRDLPPVTPPAPERPMEPAESRRPMNDRVEDVFHLLSAVDGQDHGYRAD